MKAFMVGCWFWVIEPWADAMAQRCPDLHPLVLVAYTGWLPNRTGLGSSAVPMPPRAAVPERYSVPAEWGAAEHHTGSVVS